MRTPSEKEITTALQDNAKLSDEGRWSFGGGYWHSAPEARQIVRACLTLGTPVTDVLSSASWATLIDTVATLHAAVTRLGGFPPGGE